MREEAGLIARQTKRRDVVLEADLRIAPEDAAKVRFSPAMAGRDGRIRVTIVDASVGGLGIAAPLYIPRRASIIVRAHPLDSTKPPILDGVRLIVQRSRMTDRRPGYTMGTSFAPADAPSAQAIEQFMRLLEDADDGVPAAPAARVAAPAAERPEGDRRV